MRRASAALLQSTTSTPQVDSRESGFGMSHIANHASTSSSTGTGGKYSAPYVSEDSKSSVAAIDVAAPSCLGTNDMAAESHVGFILDKEPVLSSAADGQSV